MRVMPAVLWRSITRLIAGNRLFAAALIPALVAAGGRRARLPLAVLVQRLVQLCARRGDADAGYDPALWLPPLPVAAVPRPQLFSRNGVAAPDGAARRRDDLRAGPAPVRHSRLGRRPGHAAGALRRVRDPARAPDHGGHALPVPDDGRGHRRAVVAAPVLAGLPRGRPAARALLDRPAHRPAAPRRIRGVRWSS